MIMEKWHNINDEEMNNEITNENDNEK